MAHPEEDDTFDEDAAIEAAREGNAEPPPCDILKREHDGYSALPEHVIACIAMCEAETSQERAALFTKSKPREIFTLKLTLWGISIDFKEAWWRIRCWRKKHMRIT